ncbi:MAG TPA: acyl-CoA dehydrogenase family protein [Candidatus Udaeobacter sp.]|nr:acyl-CoA dehydrogenase family protein [Candidatus Udaeobacter sp.]
MDTRLATEDLAIQARARDFTQRHLFPHEVECDLKGKLPAKILAAIRKASVEHGLAGYNHTKEDGGQGFTPLQQLLAHEELGKATNGLWTLVYGASLPLRHASDKQRREFLLPMNAGKRRACYAITEPGAGSDPRLVKTTAVLKRGSYELSGEKWFVTSADAADVILVHAHVDGDPDKPTLFIVEKNQPGVNMKRAPKFMHNYVFEHWEIVFDRVRLPADRILGGVGQGFELTKDWFTETRLELGAHCVGAATRALEIANDYAAERIQFGRPIRDFQAIEFMIADSAVEIMAAKSMLYRIGAELNQGLDRKLVHARASALKLYCSEMAGRVIDKAVQILGGRGYMRENPVERLYRDIRVERIWEGTSEIQRAVIGGQIKKRGLRVFTGWS